MASLIDELLARVQRPSPAPAQPANITDGIAALKKEDPDFDPHSVSAMGSIMQRIIPNAEAWTTPMGGVHYNPALMEGKPAEEVADTLLHELTHARQAKQRGVIGQIFATLTDRLPYGQKPDEMEAFQAEADRRTRMGRAPLLGVPNFTNPGQLTRGNINLYPERKK